MDCPHCEHDIPDLAKFCLNCGGQITRTFKYVQRPSRPSKQDTLVKALWIIAILIAGLSVGFLVKIAQQPKTLPTYARQSFTAPQPRQPQWIHRVIEPKKDTLAIPPGNYWSQEFNVTEQMEGYKAKNYQLHGRFEVQGGSKNDIRAYIFDRDGFVNWKNKNNYLRFYESGVVTVGNFDVTFNPGTYYLVFDNSMSFFSNKVVNLQMSVEVDQFR